MIGFCDTSVEKASLQRICSRHSVVMVKIQQLVQSRLVNSNSKAFKGHLHSVTLFSGEELRPIQAGNSKIQVQWVYSATVVGEEALVEDIQHYSVQYNQE